jgi:hypothetical protein
MQPACQDRVGPPSIRQLMLVDKLSSEWHKGRSGQNQVVRIEKRQAGRESCPLVAIDKRMVQRDSVAERSGLLACW